MMHTTTSKHHVINAMRNIGSRINSDHFRITDLVGSRIKQAPYKGGL